MKRKIFVCLFVLVCLLCVLAFSSCGETKYKVTFDAAGGVLENANEDGILVVKVLEGSLIEMPTNPTKDGYRFSGWYASDKASSRWNFEEDVVTSDITLTAWYAVSIVCEHEWEIDESRSTFATCELGGKLYKKCTKCSFQMSENQKSLKHEYVEDTIPPGCATEGYSIRTCSREGCTYEFIYNEKNPTYDHSWSGYKTVLDSTYYTSGIEEQNCINCDATRTYSIPAMYIEEELKNMEIGNYKYTGGKYVNESFVDISKYTHATVSSFYTVCSGSNMLDGTTDTFWCADTQAFGSQFTGDTIVIDLGSTYDVAAINLFVPYYSGWDLGDGCYVSYKLEFNVDGAWVDAGEISDKDATAKGLYASLFVEFDAPYTASQLRLTVTHSTRFAPAMIYDLQIMAKTDYTQFLPTDLKTSTTTSISGKYNPYAAGAENLYDGDFTTGWYTDYKDKASNADKEVYAILDFSEEKFIAAVQFAFSTSANREFELSYWNGTDWVVVDTFKAQRGQSISLSTGGSYDPEKVKAVTINDSSVAVFTVNLEIFTSQVKLELLSDGQYWSSYVYEFNAYTAVEQAFAVPYHSGCTHSAIRAGEVIAPTCTNAGYTIYTCSCGYTARSAATDATGHTWSEFVAPLSSSELITETSTCTVAGCNATKTRTHKANTEIATITPYYRNASCAWVMTLDDGNYTDAIEWLIPNLKDYGFKATGVLSICYSETLVSNWQEYFSSGVIDLGSHSYNHEYIYTGSAGDAMFLKEITKAHYWFMSKFAGQRLLGYATPGGATSLKASIVINDIMAAGRNGGTANGFINYIQNLTSREKWGNLECYASKFTETEGIFAFVDSNGDYVSGTTGGFIDFSGSYGKVQTGVDNNGKPVYGWSHEWVANSAINSQGIFQLTKEELDDDGNVITESTYREPTAKDYIAVRNLSGTYFVIPREDISKYSPANYVYSPISNRLENQTEISGTYYYDEEEHHYIWKDKGYYVEQGGKYVYDENATSGYRIWHVSLGSFEKAINSLLKTDGFTIECIHSIRPETDAYGGLIHVSYVSTFSKLDYLKNTGVWVPSYTELIQYIRETQNATLDTLTYTDSEITLSLTDTLDDYMFNFPLTLKIDIPESWTMAGIVATQNGNEVEWFIENGYAYVDAIPDRGEIKLVPVTCKDGTTAHEFSDYVVSTPATCTTTGEKVATCSLCGETNTQVIPVTHTFGAWTYDGLTKSSKCSTCNWQQSTTYEQIDPADCFTMTDVVLTGSSVPVGYYLFDGDWGKETGLGIVANKDSALTIEYTLQQTTYMDVIVVVGQNTTPITVEVMYEGDTTYTTVGATNGTTSYIEVGRSVTKVKLSHSAVGTPPYIYEVVFALDPTK